MNSIIIVLRCDNKKSKKAKNTLYDVSAKYSMGKLGVVKKTWTSHDDGDVIQVVWNFSSVSDLEDFKSDDTVKPLLEYEVEVW